MQDDKVAQSQDKVRRVTAKLKARLKAGEKLLGAWTMSTSPDNAEVMAQTGIDFVLMDHEHGQATLPDAIAQLRAMKGTDCAGLMRVPWNDMVFIKRALDAGIHGVMVPQVNTALGDYQPFLRPDGCELIFMSYMTGNGDFYVAKLMP